MTDRAETEDLHIGGPEDAGEWYAEEATTFGDRLAGAREANGMSQKALAQRLGIKQDTLRKWEDDLSEPRANRLSMLSGILGVTLSWLMTGRGEGPEAPLADEAIPVDVTAALGEIRALRAEMDAAARRLARVEKHLRRSLSGPA